MKLETTQVLNGVDTARLRDTINMVKATPKLGRFRFGIENRWMKAGENRSEVQSFYGCGQTQSHNPGFTLMADEPDILLGRDTGASPAEHLLHALAACVTTSMVYHAAARGINVEQVESSLEGDLDLGGFLGLDPLVRNGYRHIRLKLRIKTDARDERLFELGSLGPTFSPVYDSLIRGVPVSISAERIP